MKWHKFGETALNTGRDVIITAAMKQFCFVDVVIIAFFADLSFSETDPSNMLSDLTAVVIVANKIVSV